MARLRHESTGTLHLLGGRDLVGRSQSCHLRLSLGHISGEHAAFRWTGDGWELRDLGSRNGTFVNGHRLEVGQRFRVEPGARLSFGAARDPWIVEEAGPPLASATAEGQRRFADDGLLVLPDERSPELVVQVDGRGGWVAERAAGEVEVKDGDVVEAGGRRWALELPAAWAETRAATEAVGPNGLRLHFRVSRDEEHVVIQVEGAGAPILLDHRAHAYFLLTLARARLVEAGSLAAAEAGWLYQDELARQLGLPMGQFNMSVYRARQQFREARVPGWEQIIERRRGSGQLRLGVAALEISRS